MSTNSETGEEGTEGLGLRWGGGSQNIPCPERCNSSSRHCAVDWRSLGMRTFGVMLHCKRFLRV